MDDLGGRLLGAKLGPNPHSQVHQAQLSQSHSFLLSGAKTLTSTVLRPKQATAPSWTRMPYPRPGSHKTLTQEGHGLHTITFSTGPSVSLPSIPLPNTMGLYPKGNPTSELLTFPWHGFRSFLLQQTGSSGGTKGTERRSP